MFIFMTIEEAAEKWDMSVQQVRNLCRSGKIPSAIKKGTMWFIPNQTESPLKKAKKEFQFSGTKKKIFEASIRLFSEQAFDTITLKDIADASGIVQSAVYRHFQSKHEILETIYAYFQHYYVNERPQIEDLEETIQNGDLMEIFDCVHYDFAPERVDLMVCCMKIVFQRMSIDENAGEIFRNQILGSGLDFAKQVFEKAIHAGRLPQTDPFVLSAFSNMSRQIIMLSWLANGDPALNQELRYCERALQNMIIRALTRDDDHAH